jgi:hypothetical protein
VGYNAPGGYIDSVAFGGDVTGVYQVGGLVGLNNKEVKNSEVSETVTVTGVSLVGGSVGMSTPWPWAVVKNCNFYGHANGGPYVGCHVFPIVIRAINSPSFDSYEIGWYVGGVLGINEGTVEDCISEGSVSGRSYVGGLTGSNNGTVESCDSNSDVTGTSNVGGLAGLNRGNVGSCSSGGNVTGDSNVGGLVGVNHYGSVTDSSSKASVAGVNIVGGLVGLNDMGTVTNSYSSASLTGDSNVGCVVGYNTGTVTNSDCLPTATP